MHEIKLIPHLETLFFVLCSFVHISDEFAFFVAFKAFADCQLSRNFFHLLAGHEKVLVEASVPIFDKIALFYQDSIPLKALANHIPVIFPVNPTFHLRDRLPLKQPPHIHCHILL